MKKQETQLEWHTVNRVEATSTEKYLYESLFSFISQSLSYFDLLKTVSNNKFYE